MSKRQHAPGSLEHVRAFVNTRDLEDGTEQLSDPSALARWLSARGLALAPPRATVAELVRAIQLREAIRAILLAHNTGEAPPVEAARVLDAAARRAALALRFSDDGRTMLEPRADGVDGALGRLLAIIHESEAGGTWWRLKACAAHDCEWAFYDHTKNRSGTWCNMQVCGNRAKARAYRERRAG